MQQKTIKRFSVWLAWQHEREERWLDSLSAQGLHLTKSVPFVSTFTVDQSTRFTYRLDYHPITDRKGFQEYLDLYADAGWEYQCSLHSWHYFRRPWASGQTQELYTDRASLVQHYRRIQRFLGFVGLLNLFPFLSKIGHVFFPDPTSETDSLGIVLIGALVLSLVGYGLLALNSRIKALKQGIAE